MENMKWKSGPVSMTELGVYLDWTGNLSGDEYNIPFLLPIPEGTDLDRLENALNAVLRAHPGLFSRFRANSDGTVSRLTPDVDTSELNADIRHDAGAPDLASLIRPFDDPEGCLFRICIVGEGKEASLFMDFHHLVFDGTSAQVFIRDLNRAYRDEGLDCEKITPARFASGEQDARKTEDFAKAEAWYDRIFSGVDVCSVPYHDKEEGEKRQECLTIALDCVPARVRRFVRDLGVRTSSLFTCAYGFALSRFAGSEEALFASVHNGRSPEIAEDIGMFVKTFPVLERFGAGETIKEHLKALDEQLLGHRENRLFSFVDACSKYGLSIPTMFAYQGGIVGGEVDFLGSRLALSPIVGKDPKNELTAEVMRTGEGYSLRISYRSDLYDEESMRNFAQSYNVIVCGILEKSGEEFSRIGFASKGQMAALDGFLPPIGLRQDSGNIVAMFREQARRCPETAALVIGDAKKTYREVDEASDRIALKLMEMGVGRGDAVAILIHRNEYMAIASLGALKAGAGYQPLDPTYPSDRLSFMVRDSKAKAVIADDDLLPLLEGYSGVVLLTRDVPRLPVPGAGVEMPVPDSHDMFTLLYTSGSTGTPKGVVLEHGNLVNFCRCYQEEFGLGEGVVHSAYASYGFDANMMDMYPALTSGGTVCVVPEEMRLDFPSLGEYFGKNNVSVSFMTTQVGRQFAQSPFRPSCLKRLLMGGEMLAPMAPPDGLELFNLYGPTECTVFVTRKKVDRKCARIPIGSSFAGAALYVVDESGRRVPPCAPGELWIAGPCVAREYLNRPDLTRKAFIPNPFRSDEGYERIYRTGDTVRFLPNGEIDFLGRNDGQVKIRGFRVELGEIESVIRDYPGVRDVCVHAWDTGESGKVIAAYFSGEGIIDPDSIKSFVRERKPPYMVPASVIRLEAMPLNQNGKVNRKMLPKPEFNASSSTLEAASARADNVLEVELKGAMRQITGIGGAPLAAPLEFAGLTSIGMIRLAAFVFSRFGIALKAKDLKNASLLDLENMILKRWMEAPARNQPSGQTSEVEIAAGNHGNQDPYPLSASQLGIYMECMKKPESMVYNIPVVMRFESGTDADKLSKAVAAVVKAHPSVNVHFSVIDGRAMAIPDAVADVSVPIHGMSEAEREKYAADFSRAFRLNKGPLYSLAIVKTEKAVWLYMDFHHLIFDGYSLDLFLHDLSQELGAEGCAPETAGYADFVRMQESRLNDEAARDEAYFAKLFADYDSPSQVTPDMPKSDRPGKSGIVKAEIDQNIVDEALKRTGASEAAFFLAVTDYVAARFTNSDNVYIATISSGRSDARFSRTYGMFVNTLPLASSLTDGSVDEYVRKTADGLAEAIEHENYPFAKIADKWGFSVGLMFAYQRDIVQRAEIPGLVSMKAEEPEDLKFPMFIRIVQGDCGPAVEVEYDDSKYSRRLAEKIARCFRIVAERFALNGSEKVRGVSLVDEAEQRALDGFHTVREEAVVGDDVFFFTGMERSAAEHPDRIALIAADGRFTYREFDSITNRVANALVKMGAERGGKALVLLNRTSKALFAIFGASKAGLGYIPFDPAYPDERIRMVIEDSDAQFVITSAQMLPRFDGRRAVDIEELLKETDSSKPRVTLSQNDISYMIYTSGSTGRPKGVALTHRGMAHYVADMPGKEMVGLLRDCCRVYCSITTLSFDISVMEYSLALSHGLTLFFADEDECNDADLLAEGMLKVKADVISGTPSRIQTLMSSSAFCRALRENVKLVICGGEKYPDKLMSDLKALVPHPMNIYGPSEITISCNEHDLANDDAVSIGRPTPGVVEYIVDTDGNELPVGMEGEVYIGGWGVALGYVNLPELTEERFISYKGGRVYKSGDYGRWLENGYMQILGRKDNQIKLRGLRIELGEIESVLASQPGMGHVAVKIEKINGIEHLCAWFSNEDKVDIRALKESLGRTLTPYMVPTAYMQLDRIPFTPNGKLDLRNLPLPEVFRGGGDEARTKAERDFCAIFSSLLGIGDVLPEESFFDLGGTSLLATRVVIEANKRGYGIVFGDVFANPTARRLASRFEQDQQDALKPQGDSEVESYDYSAINRVLEGNALESCLKGEDGGLGNVLLAGATGYLGAHVLHELIENSDSVIYCLVRTGRRKADIRLKELLMYYFDSPASELFGNRIRVVEGDITQRASLDALKAVSIDTVINCAASVKHFAVDSRIEDINVGGVRNLVDFCLSEGAMLIQASTLSVVEMGFKDMAESVHPDERSLHFGQDLTNKYARSKFLAEREILEAVAGKGLRAKIMRYGNLSARQSDGEFQINFESNSAMGRLRAFALLGCAPFGILDDVMEFSPIDSVAKATVLLARTPRQAVVFHVATDQYVRMAHVFAEMGAVGRKVDFVERSAFDKALERAQSDPKKAVLLTSLMAYASGSGERERRLLPVDRNMTLQTLYRKGFVWPMLSQEYFARFVGALSGLGYFDD